MTRDEALSRIRPHEAELRAAGLAALYLFGSTARDEAGPQSDVDLAFELREAIRFGLISQIKLEDRLGDIVGSKVDLVAREGFRPRIRARVEPELVKVF